jgi:hypothetical protein
MVMVGRGGGGGGGVEGGLARSQRVLNDLANVIPRRKKNKDLFLKSVMHACIWYLIEPGLYFMYRSVPLCILPFPLDF